MFHQLKKKKKLLLRKKKLNTYDFQDSQVLAFEYCFIVLYFFFDLWQKSVQFQQDSNLIFGFDNIRFSKGPLKYYEFIFSRSVAASLILRSFDFGFLCLLPF